MQKRTVPGEVSGMAGRGPRGAVRAALAHPRNALVVLVVVVLAAAAIGALAYEHGRNGSPTDTPAAGGAPSPSGSPSGSPVPTPAPVLPVQAESAQLPTAAGLASALAPALRLPAGGGAIGWAVADATSGRLLGGAGAQARYTPASVTKLTSALAVLAGPGPDHRISTTVLAGSTPGQVVVVGGGDPTLSVGGTQAYPGAARLDVLARQVRTALAGQPVTSVVIDGSAYTRATLGPGWDTGLVSSGDVAPITALMVNGGRLTPTGSARTRTPDVDAARDLARLLGAPRAPITRGQAPAGARQLGSVSSMPLSRMIEYCLQASDNVLAEELARQVAIWAGQPASFAGAATAVRARLAALGLPADQDGLVDGSGLSRLDRLTPTLLVQVLAAATRGTPAAARDLLAGLPVAGYSGTLAARYRGGSTGGAAGRVRAKTGSLSSVASLAGVVTDNSGHQLVFAFLANRVPPGGGYAADTVLDRLATTLAACGCR